MNNSLAEVHPELVSEWSEKNLTLTPDDITFGSNKKVWWRGACGHEWQASVKARSNGEKCPICSGARVIAGINDLATLEPLLVKQWSKKNKIKPIEVSIGSHKKVIWRCKKGHEWEAAVKSRTINKTGCPYCSHNKVLAGFNDLATLLPDIAAEWSDRNYPLLPTQVTVFANRKAWWKCKDCGREWNTLISTRSGGSKCPYCSGYIFLKGFNDLQTTHPEIASEWSEKNLPLKPDEVNAKSRKNVWWKCRKCGNEWKSVINARVKGTVCPVCAEREVLAGYNDLATTDSQLLSEWDYEQNKLKPTEVSRTSAKRAWWKCRHGHSWSMKINERTILNKGCRICEQEYLSLLLRRNRSSNSCLRHERYRFCRKRPDYRSQQSVRFHLRTYPCHRSYPAWLRYRSGRSLFEVSRPVSESQRLPDPCGRYHHHLCQGNPDPYYRLKEHSYQTGHTWRFRYAPNLKGGANR